PGSMLDVTGGAVQLSAVDLTVSKAILRVAATGNAAVEIPVGGGPGSILLGAIEATDTALSTTGTGAIQLTGGPITLRDGTAVSANAGGVDITADALSLRDGAKITRKGTNQSNAGSVTVNTNDLSMLSGSQIVSSSLSTQQNARNDHVAIRGQQGDGSLARSLLASGSNTPISTATDGASQ